MLFLNILHSLRILNDITLTMTTIQKLLPFLLAPCFLACSGRSGSTEVADTAATEQAPSARRECFTYQMQKDTAWLHLNTDGNSVTGELSYALFEKDKNSGRVAGEMRGDTLVADYTFMSEGVESVREVVFLKKDGGWTEGFGEVTDAAGKMAFKDRSKLDFAKGMHFRPTDCAGLPH